MQLLIKKLLLVEIKQLIHLLIKVILSYLLFTSSNFHYIILLYILYFNIETLFFQPVNFSNMVGEFYMSKQNADNKYQTLDFNRGFKIDNPTQFAVSSSSADALPHSHTFIELMYVNSGTIAHAINFGKPTILKKGDFMLIDTDSVHEYINTDKQPCEIVNLAFTGNFIDRRLTTNSKLASIFRSNKLGLNAVYSPPLEIIMHDEDKSIINTITLIKNEFNRNDELSANILRHLTISILVSMTRIPHGNSNHYMSDIVASMISYIESHYTQKNILQDAATELNYYVAYLSN